MADSESDPRYVRPGWFTNHVGNPIVALLTCRINPDHLVFRIEATPPD